MEKPEARLATPVQASAKGVARSGMASSITAVAGVAACAVCCAIPAAWPALVVVGIGGLVASRWPARNALDRALAAPPDRAVPRE